MFVSRIDQAESAWPCLIDIPTVFARTGVDGQRAWETLIARALRLPKLEPILAAFPGEVRSGLLEQATAWDESGT